MDVCRRRALLMLSAALALVAASLACNPPQASTPLPPTAYVAPTSTPALAPTAATAAATAAAPPDDGGGTTPAAGGPDVRITGVTLGTETPATGEAVAVQVTLENQGGADASGFELVLIPHYGWGPPNPAGYEPLPTLAPGASHTVSFDPGPLYVDAGTFTLRVLVTDDWYAVGDPDSTGSGGDIHDVTITVGGGG
jgi:hypothetical protein